MDLPSITDIKCWSTQQLIQHLREKDLLSDSHLAETLTTEKIDGASFLELTRQDLAQCNIPMGPAIKVIKYIDELKDASPPSAVPPPATAVQYTRRHGGVGGTLLPSPRVRAGNYEGIDITSSDICLREDTIEKMIMKLNKVGVLLVRSPPMSGKTSLSQLLEQKLLSDSADSPDSPYRVFRISLIWMNNSSDWTFDRRFHDLMGITWAQFLDECDKVETFLIVDEVQMLYQPQGSPDPLHNGSVFWNVFKKCQQTSNLSIVAFAGYGYMGAWDSSAPEITPYMIPLSNTWSLEDVRFTDDEYNDYFSRFCKNYLQTMVPGDVRSLQNYVRSTTACHPGLVAFFMEHICNHFLPKLKYKRELQFEEVFLYLKSHKFITAVDAGVRAYSLHNLTEKEMNLCDEVFQAPHNTRRASQDHARLVRTGILTTLGGGLDFASPFLRALYLQRRWGNHTRPTNPPETFRSFLEAVFGNISLETIKNSYSRGKDGRVLERQWQMEFYRAAAQVVPSDVYISADVGTYWGSKGFLDFWVDDERNWGIELLRDGSDASRHKDRFETGGIYESIRKISKEWAVIDIRHPGLRKAPPACDGDDHWVNVYCQKGWKSVIIQDKDSKVQVPLLGGQSYIA